MTYQDIYKTVGEIRGAAYDLWEESGESLLHTQLHDSICLAFPSDSNTPVSVTRAAAVILDALKEFIGAVDTGTTFADQSVVDAARAAIARATA